jgi:hypothetical protein
MPSRESAPREETAPQHSRFGELHARTYEMELLVSGAVVFGLLLLPPVVTRAFERFTEGLVGDLRLVTSAIQGYVTLALWVLITAFLLHLVLRAYWIGLLGLESVFVEGIRWDRVRLGPYTVKTLRERIGSLGGAVDSVDDLCSLVFSFGFLIVIIFLYSVVVLLLAVASALAVSRLAFSGKHLAVLAWILFFVFLGSQSVPNVLDRRFGPRLTPGSVPARLLQGLVRAGYALSPTRWTGPIQLTLGSNTSPARLATMIILVCVALGTSYVGATLVRGGALRLDNRAYFPDSLQEHGIDPQHYRDRRDGGPSDATTPSIQSLFVGDSYLELVVPYSPRRHNALIEAACPGVAPLRAVGLVRRDGDELASDQVAAVAACLGSLFEVRLDERRLENLRWDFTVEARRHLPAVVAVVLVSGLERGRHELEVAVPGRKATAQDPDFVLHRMPFWL